MSAHNALRGFDSMPEPVEGSGATDSPLPGIIDLAPEIPVALHIVPRHNSEEISRWFAGKAKGQRAAERRGVDIDARRRITETEDEMGAKSFAVDEISSSSDEASPSLIRRVLEETEAGRRINRYDDADTVLDKIDKGIVEESEAAVRAMRRRKEHGIYLTS